MREVRDGEGGGNTAVLVEENDVGETGGVGALDEVWEHEIASVEADGRGEEEADFFGESGES